METANMFLSLFPNGHIKILDGLGTKEITV